MVVQLSDCRSILVLTGLCTALLGNVNTEGNAATPVLVAQQATSRTPQTITGRLDQNSPVREEDGSHHATHSFKGTAGETLAIELSSDDFDTYLVVQDPQGKTIAIDNDGAGGTNSLIVISLSDTGSYTVVVNTASTGETGQYRVEWRTPTAVDQDLALASQLTQQVNDLYGSVRYGEAIPLAERALAIREAQLGAEHPYTATSLNNLALLYESIGRYEEAELLYQRVLAIREAQLGANHPSTAASLNNLGVLYRSMGRYGEAEPLDQQALAINEAQLGAEHPSTAISLNNLALLYDSMGRYEEAEPLYQRASSSLTA